MLCKFQLGMLICSLGLTLYNILMITLLRSKTLELLAFENTLKELLLRIRLRGIKRK